MGDYETDAYIMEIIAKYGRADIKTIVETLGRDYYINYTNQRVKRHCLSLCRYGELKMTVVDNSKKNAKRFVFEIGD